MDFTSSYARVLTTFIEEDYEGEFVKIGKYLSSLQKDESWSTEDFHRIRKKAYKYFLKDGALWRHTKKEEWDSDESCLQARRPTKTDVRIS